MARLIRGFPGYTVDEYGIVVGPTGRIGSIDRDGYEKVTLTGPSGKKRCCHVHTLVLEAFVGPRPRGRLAMHIDGEPGNAALSNLRWATYAELVAARDERGRTAKGADNGRAKLTGDDVEEIRSRRADGETLRDLADAYGLTHRTVHDICAGVLWSEK